MITGSRKQIRRGVPEKKGGIAGRNRAHNNIPTSEKSKANNSVRTGHRVSTGRKK